MIGVEAHVRDWDSTHAGTDTHVCLEAVAPSSTNREAQLTQRIMEVGLHYFTGTSSRTIEEVLGVLSEFLGEFEKSEHGTKLYEELWHGVAGAQVQYKNRLSKSEDVYVVLTGETCDYLGTLNTVAIATLLNIAMTRIDIAVDYAPFTPMHLNEAYKQNFINTRVRRGGRGRRFIESDDGNTFYLGSPKSDTMLRCYDQRGFTRVEMQLRRKRAKRFFEELLMRDEQELGDLAIGVIRSHVDFVIPSGTDSNKSRWELLPFWQDFVNGIKKVRLIVPKPSPNLDKMKEHVRKQAAMLFTYTEVLRLQGSDPVRSLSELLRHGKSKIKDKHKLLIKIV